MRVVKDAAERKNEILDIAERLFNEKGYSQTTVEDIM
ncbi:MAG: TetR/AcrR family transcriptional regulator, partial [Lachnospiraceae bacterium]|nr:TetR/AcrR family transcriptional regulator [Lachnospiraceae bacterium]